MSTPHLPPNATTPRPRPRPQSLRNHARLDPSYHFFILPVLLVSLALSLVRFARHLRWHTGWMVLLAAALLLLAFKARSYALKAQDRVIRLEERQRLSLLMPEKLRPRIAELTESQLIALRFASDAELPALTLRALDEHLTKEQIKQAILHWRADYFRV